MIKRHQIQRLASAIVVTAVATSCSGGGGSPEPTTLTLVAYESFPTDATNPIAIALAEFTQQTGVAVEILIAGDAGTMLSKAALTSGRPEGDVMWGIDNSFLSRAINADIFDSYTAVGLDSLPLEFTEMVPSGEVTPVDFGDVCVNYDIGALAEAGLEPPKSMAELAQPEYASRLVVENPATSSPGLAFLLATIAEFGQEGWEAYWTMLAANGVLVVDGWSQAYYEEFSRAGGSRPLVVSYGSSPPFEVLYSNEPVSEPPTGVVESTCFRQVEFAGVLRGTDSPDAARLLIDFLVSERFQREIALNLFVFPVNPAVHLEQVFLDFATIPGSPLSIKPDLIDKHRADWIDRWTSIAGH